MLIIMHLPLSLSRNKHKYFFMGTHTCRHTCTHTHTSIEREPSVVHLQALCGSLLPVPVQELRHNYVQDAHTHILYRLIGVRTVLLN